MKVEQIQASSLSPAVATSLRHILGNDQLGHNVVVTTLPAAPDTAAPLQARLVYPAPGSALWDDEPWKSLPFKPLAGYTMPLGSSVVATTTSAEDLTKLLRSAGTVATATGDFLKVYGPSPHGALVAGVIGGVGFFGHTLGLVADTTDAVLTWRDPTASPWDRGKTVVMVTLSGTALLGDVLPGTPLGHTGVIIDLLRAGTGLADEVHTVVAPTKKS
jgi:hypothetical protein